jgi:hypothetical protein
MLNRGSRLVRFRGNGLTWGRIFSAEGTPPLEQEPIPPSPMEPERKSRKKLYALLGVVAVAVVLIAVILPSMIPQGLGETIPYGISYNVGEKLTYSISVSLTYNGQQVSETGTMSMHVVSFDGDNYTIDEAVHYELQGTSQDNSFTLIMNKAGQLVGTANLPSQIQDMTSMIQGSPGYGLFLNTTEVRVGETFHVPMDMGNSTFTMTGTENCKIGAVENITVQAGTYKTFKIDLSTSNLHASTQGIDVSLSLSGHMHMEYGTDHCIDFSLQGTETAQGMSLSLTMDMALTSDTVE